MTMTNHSNHEMTISNRDLIDRSKVVSTEMIVAHDVLLRDEMTVQDLVAVTTDLVLIVPHQLSVQCTLCHNSYKERVERMSKKLAVLANSAPRRDLVDKSF